MCKIAECVPACHSGSAQVCTAKKVLANADIEIGLELILKETFEYLY